MAESTNKINKLTIVVGAGDDFSCNLTEPAQNYLLIDARREAVDALQQSHAGDTRVDVQQTVITPVTGRTQFYHYSLPEFSSTLKPEALKQLLPGLSLKGSEYVSGVSLSDIILEEPPAEHLELILNVPGQELALLQSLQATNNLLALDALTVTSTTDMLYEEGNTSSQLDDWLSQQGFKQQQETEQAFGLVTQQWSIDKKATRISMLESECDELRQQLSQETKRANTAQSKINELVELLNQAKQAHGEAVARASSASEELEAVTKQRDEAVARASSASKELEQQKQWHATHKKRAEELENQANELKAENQSLKQSLETLNKAFAESQTQLLQKLDRLMTSQERQTRRLETSLGMHQFWQTGEYRQLGQEDNLGPQFKQFLLQKLSEEHYDIVLQFGASDATLFMAQVVKKLKGTNRQLTSYINEDALDFKNNSKAVTNARADKSQEQDDYEDVSLPAEICVFEHNANKLKELERQAKQKQLGNLISTKHAPLVDYTHHGQDYLHYDSDDSLTQIKELLEGRAAKVLVIVSGPITSSEDHNRFPAGPKLLNTLSKHEIHFVTDNYHDKNAKDVAVMWSRLFDERGLSIEKQIIADEKPGFAWLLNR